MSAIRWFLFACVLASGAAAQTVAIVGGTVYPVSGPKIEHGTVLVRDGKIVAVGAGVSVPTGATTIDATGKWVTPGIFNAASFVGVAEVELLANTNDNSARGRGDGLTPSFRVWDGFNPASPLVQSTRNDGVTTITIMPVEGLLSGQGAVVELGDGGLSQMLVKAPVAIFADPDAARPAHADSRGEAFQTLRDVLTDARVYARRRGDYERGESREMAARQADLEALQGVLDGRMPLVIIANRASDIEVALDIAREFKIRVAIASAAEGWKVADKLAAAKVPVLVGALNNIPFDFSALGARQDNAALLARAGVPLVIAELNLGPPAGYGAYNARNIKYEAGLAVAYGLAWDAALRAVTLAPAELYGVADRVGSLAPGKDATLVIWSGDPFELYTRAEKVFVRGAEVERPSRQDELMRRYRVLAPDYLRVPQH